MWCVEWHPKGGVRVGELGEIVERNKLMFREGRAIEWVVVDCAVDLAEANVKKLEIKRIKRGLEHDVDSKAGAGVEAAADSVIA